MRRRSCRGRWKLLRAASGHIWLSCRPFCRAHIFLCEFFRLTSPRRGLCLLIVAHAHGRIARPVLDLRTAASNLAHAHRCPLRCDGHHLPTSTSQFLPLSPSLSLSLSLSLSHTHTHAPSHTQHRVHTHTRSYTRPRSSPLSLSPLSSSPHTALSLTRWTISAKALAGTNVNNKAGAGEEADGAQGEEREVQEGGGE